MNKSSQRLFVYEIILSLLILFVTLSVTNLIFTRSMTQHKMNQAMMKISEEMVLISEELEGDLVDSIYLSNLDINYDSNGDRVESKYYYQLQIRDEKTDDYILYKLSLYNRSDEKLLSWDIVKVVK